MVLSDTVVFKHVRWQINLKINSNKFSDNNVATIKMNEITIQR